MINVVLRGGVGNQMFQFAAGYALAKKFNTGIIFDITNYRTDNMRMYSLDLFGGIRGRYEKVVDSLVDVHEDGMPFNQTVSDSINKDSCIKGYWQTEKYFPDLEHALFSRFTPFQPISSYGRDTLREIQDAGDSSVFLTVRRTDYVGNSFHGELPIEYYREALNHIYSRTGIKPRVFVFSDEPEWVIANFYIQYPFSVNGNWDRTVRGHLGREDEELFLMSRCKHAVMANSSYSWWGAYLGDVFHMGTNRVVVCPKNWFGPASTEDPRDIPRESWIQL